MEAILCRLCYGDFEQCCTPVGESGICYMFVFTQVFEQKMCFKALVQNEECNVQTRSLFLEKERLGGLKLQLALYSEC